MNYIVIKLALSENKNLDVEYNFKMLNQYLVEKHLKLSVLRGKEIGKADEIFNNRLLQLRSIGYANRLDIPDFIKESAIWEQWIHILRKQINKILFY